MLPLFDHEKLEVYPEALAFLGLIRANSDYRVHEGGGGEDCDQD